MLLQNTVNQENPVYFSKNELSSLLRILKKEIRLCELERHYDEALEAVRLVEKILSSTNLVAKL